MKKTAGFCGAAFAAWLSGGLPGTVMSFYRR